MAIDADTAELSEPRGGEPQTTAAETTDVHVCVVGIAGGPALAQFSGYFLSSDVTTKAREQVTARALHTASNVTNFNRHQ